MKDSGPLSTDYLHLLWFIYIYIYDIAGSISIYGIPMQNYCRGPERTNGLYSRFASSPGARLPLLKLSSDLA